MMKKLTKQIIASLTTGALALSMLATTASAAEIKITNSTNGRDSNSNGAINIQRSTSVEQVNNVDVDNKVDQNADTGNNQVKDNFGSVDVQTGSVDQQATVRTEAGSNAAQLDQCDCDFDVEIVNEKNGRDSDNSASFDADVHTELGQFNDVNVDNRVDQDAETGDNQLKDNYSDDEAGLETGSVDQDAMVQTSTGLNQAVLGSGNGSGSSEFNLVNTGNGRDSDNNIEVGVDLTTEVEQVNEVDVNNKLDQGADTGNNALKDNMGGVDVETGDVDQTAKVYNEGGANALQVDNCLCDVDVEIENEKNGRDSENDAELWLGISDYFGQFNEDVDFYSNLDQDGETGDNEVKDNMRDDFVTGSIDSDVEVTNSAGLNTIGDVSMDSDWDSTSLMSVLEALLQVLED